MNLALASPQKYTMLIKPWQTLADGFCVIDIFHKDGAVSDRGTFSQIRQAAQSILDECLGAGSTGPGGYVRDLGDFGNLAVVMSQYQPSVSCRGHVDPIPTVQQALIDTIPVNTLTQNFGPPGHSDAQVAVPKTFSIPPVPRR